MTNRKSTKRALLGSIMAMVLCLAMLVGATFAWFTDTASTGVNKIQAGNLDVALEMKEGDSWVSAEGKTLNWVKAAAGEQVLWEPGCTYTLPELRVVNNGNLALKYKLVISGIQGDAELNNVIDWTMTLDGAAYTLGEEHHLAAKNGETVDADVLTISGKMQESAGNDYMNKSIDGIAITVVASQDTVEYDSINNTYDANAEYPAMPFVTSHEALNTSLTLADIPTNEATGKHDPVEVALGNTEAGDIAYSEHSSGYTGKGVMLGSTKLNSYVCGPGKGWRIHLRVQKRHHQQRRHGLFLHRQFEGYFRLYAGSWQQRCGVREHDLQRRGELRYPDVHLSVELSALHHLQELHLQRYRRGLLPGGEGNL